MKKIIVALFALVFAVAATPSEVAPVIAETGYFIEDGADATDEVIGTAVSDARNAGGDLSIVALAEDPPQGCATFAESTLEQTPSGEGTVLCLSPGLVGWAKNNSYWTTSELNDATEAALDGATSDDSAVLFVNSLLGVDEGGGNGLLIFLGFVVLVPPSSYQYQQVQLVIRSHSIDEPFDCRRRANLPQRAYRGNR